MIGYRVLCIAFVALLSFAFCLAPIAKAEAPQSESFDQVIKPFLGSYCVSCHGIQKQKGDRRFDTLQRSISDDNTLVDYQDILDQLNLGEMPPAKAKQPSDAQRKRAIDWLTARIQRHHATSNPASEQSVLRRLNAREYRTTVRDLLHLNLQFFDPTQEFPSDETTNHLDNDGQTLVTSGFLLASYLNAADEVIQKAIHPIKKPKVQKWVFRDGFKQQPEIDQVHKKTNSFKHMTLYDVVGADKPEGAYGPIHAFAKGVPIDGFYEIKLKAEAVNRLHPYDDSFLGRDRNDPLRLGIRPGDHTVGNLHLSQPIEPLLAEIELADKQKWYTVKVWLDKGITPRFTFRNGLMDARGLWGKVIKKYPKQFPKTGSGIVIRRFNAIKFGKLPHIRIHEIQIRGPIYEQWPRKSQHAVLGDDWQSVVESDQISDAVMNKHVRRFASEAYRRNVSDAEVDRITRLIRRRQKEGRSAIEAYGDGLKAILCSPGFLYLDTKTDGNDTQNRLAATAVAARLSYFLWSSQPDERLRESASRGRLLTDEGLATEVKRMLADPKSDAFIDGFLDAWLTFRDLGSAPPDRGDFGPYYQYDLATAMRTETQMFMRHLIDKNLSLVNFIDSDFTFVNKPLAKLYGLDSPSKPGFHKVALDDRRRGGLLGQSSVLTVTANGIDTSPVVRGVWLLENILGTPPSPPPPDVEPLDPDVRGAKTIRDQLAKHRNAASCADCHRKIDPLGFALENYDPIGRWRTSYSRNTTIDASGELPNGKHFKNIIGLKDVLLQQQGLFAKSLTEKLMAYGLGRQVVAADRPEVERILTNVKQSGWGLRDLINEVVLSKTFRTK